MAWHDNFNQDIKGGYSNIKFSLFWQMYPFGIYNKHMLLTMYWDLIIQNRYLKNEYGNGWRWYDF